MAITVASYPVGKTPPNPALLVNAYCALISFCAHTSPSRSAHRASRMQSNSSVTGPSSIGSTIIGKSCQSQQFRRCNEVSSPTRHHSLVSFALMALSYFAKIKYAFQNDIPVAFDSSLAFQDWQLWAKNKVNASASRIRRRVI